MEEKSTLNRKGLLIGIILTLLALAIGTYAWYSYQTKRSAMVLTVGEINKLRVTLTPYQFNGSITPSTTYTDNSYTQITAVNNVTSAGKINVYYQINSIDAALINSGFKFTVCKSTDGTSYPSASCTTGNFSSASTVTGSTIPVLTNASIAGNTTTYYRVYLWIDKSSGNQAAMQNKVFDGELRADILTTLPASYQQVQYLRSTGTQYIDTDFKLNQNSRVVIEASLPVGNLGYGYRLFGARNAASNKGFFISSSTSTNNSGLLYADYGNSGASFVQIDNNVHMYDFNKNVFSLDGTTLKTFTTSTFTTSYNAILFGGNSGGTIVAKSWQIYSCKIYDNGTLIRDFIPCYRKSDNVAGMYDIVNNAFYTDANANATNFQVGPNV